MTRRQTASSEFLNISLNLFPFLMLIALITAAPCRLPAQSATQLASARKSVQYLAAVMDQYHDRYWVFEDINSPANHFKCPAPFSGGGGAVYLNSGCTSPVYQGATSFQCKFTYSAGSTSGYGGFNLLNGILPDGAVAPLANFGDTPNAGILELAGATRLVFYARGAKGGEKVDFFCLGVGRSQNPPKPYPDSSPSVHLNAGNAPETLSNQWKRYEIPLAGKDLSYVLGGFGAGTSAANDADHDGSVVFYVDSIYFELSPSAQQARLNQPRFPRSYTTLPVQSLPAPVGEFDAMMQGTAFTYDSALAVLAFLAEGSADSLRRARLIGDAFVYAADHDHRLPAGRLRDAYSAGDLTFPPGWTPNGRTGCVTLSGYTSPSDRQYRETFQDGMSTGNNAWAMIALLGLYKKTGQASYLATARTLGNFLLTFKQTSGPYQGFRGGYDDPEGAATLRQYASTEHNLDLYAAFTQLGALTNESQWAANAQHALTFIGAMRDATRGGFLAGTHDPNTLNTTAGQYPLDVQAWSVLALNFYHPAPDAALASAERYHAVKGDGFSGFDFNDDRDGIVWFEGTGQMAVAYAQRGAWLKASQYCAELARAQATAPWGDGQGIAAASRDGLTTGFQNSDGSAIRYFRRLHVSATAWNVFSQLRYNPFNQTFITNAAHDGARYQ